MQRVTEQDLRQQRLQLLRDELTELESQLQLPPPAAQEAPRGADRPASHQSLAGTSDRDQQPVGLTLKARIRSLLNISVLTVACTILLLTLTGLGIATSSGGSAFIALNATQIPGLSSTSVPTRPVVDAVVFVPQASAIPQASVTPQASPTAAQVHDATTEVFPAQTPDPTSTATSTQPAVDVASVPIPQPVATRDVISEGSTIALTPVSQADPGIAPLATNESLPPGLAAVVARYGIDPQQRFLVVDQDTQQLTVWNPGGATRILPISTGGADGYITPPWSGRVGNYVGTIYSFGTYADDAWYLFKSLDSILIHGAPYQIRDNNKVYEGIDALGNVPISHGCIRLSPEDARWLTEWNPYQVQLVILPMSANAR